MTVNSLEYGDQQFFFEIFVETLPTTTVGSSTATEMEVVPPDVLTIALACVGSLLFVGLLVGIFVCWKRKKGNCLNNNIL